MVHISARITRPRRARQIEPTDSMPSGDVSHPIRFRTKRTSAPIALGSPLLPDRSFESPIPLTPPTLSRYT